MKTILITGGTSGIGLELVKYFDKGDYQVYFTTRNQSKADKIIKSINSKLNPVWSISLLYKVSSV